MSNIDPVRVAFEEWLSTPKPYMVTQMEMYEAAFKAGRESMRDEIINEFAVFSDTLWLKKAIKELK